MTQEIIIRSFGYADNLPDTTKKMRWKAFKEMVDQHDLTYSYSDDHRWYSLGCKSYDAIMQAAKQFPRANVVKCWNAMVDRNLIESAREQFYWHPSWKCKDD